MTIKKLIIGTLIGTAASFVFGFLIYAIAFSDFFASNVGSATGVMKSDEEMAWIPMFLGHFSFGLLIALIYGRWANIKTLANGAKTGAVIGLLFAATHDFINLATANVMNTTGALGDIAASALITAITGGAVGWYFGRD